jgi:two-component system sensor histidine kinase QseC
MKSPWSLQQRLAAALVLGGGLTLGVLFLALDYFVDRELYSRFDDALVARGRALAGLVEARPPVTRPAVEERWPEYAANRHQEFYQVWDETGATLARSASSHAADLPRPPRAVAGRPVLYDLILPDGHRGRAVALVVTAPGAADGAGLRRLLVVATEREAIESLESRLHASLVLGTLGALAVMGFASVVAVRRGLAPLAEFGRAMTARAAATTTRDATALAPAAADPGQLPRELQPIARTLDAALDETLAALAREQRFARDAAHELRTPLAELRMLAEDLPRTPQTAADVAAIVRTVDGMTRAVEALLALARCEAGLEAPSVEPLDLAALVRRQFDLLAAERAARGLVLEAALPAELWISSDAAMLERILANLVGNAVAHAPAASQIHVGLVPGVDGLALCIVNPLTERDAARITVAAGARGGPTSGAGAGHAGLGVLLARALARQLGLQLDFETREGQLTVTLGGLVAVAT